MATLVVALRTREPLTRASLYVASALPPMAVSAVPSIAGSEAIRRPRVVWVSWTTSPMRARIIT